MAIIGAAVPIVCLVPVSNPILDELKKRDILCDKMMEGQGNAWRKT